MAAALARAHLEAQARLRRATVRQVEAAARRVPLTGPRAERLWLAQVLPAVLGGQRMSALETNAYLARALGRQPLAIAPERVTGAQLRGVDPREVYRRPLVTLWGGLADGHPYEQAAGAAVARASATAAMDVAMAMRAMSAAVQEADPAIQGWQRVADPDCCTFCQEVDGAVVLSADAMPLHNHCGCGVEPLTDSPTATATPATVAVEQHGELGPVLADPADNFTGPADL